MGLITAVRTYGRMVKVAHSAFALPFALCGAALAAAHHGVTLAQLGWIVVAMVGARSAAMGFNRLVDRRIDAANPRTRSRELPQGLVSVRAVGLLITASAGALVLAAWRLNPLCLYLSPLALAVLLAYSYTKRFTWASHLVLGGCLGAAPVGAWIAVTGAFAWIPVVLGLAVLAWVAGFDVIYACQDVDFDRGAGLHSLPVRLGVRRALQVSRLLHLVAVILLAVLGWRAGLGPAYGAGVAVVGLLLLYEHRLVRADDLGRLDTAFFTMNGIISVVYFAFTLADLLARGPARMLVASP
ncbi:MAG: UbiA-like polyprenyltransferase [Candidatus Latescibacterota bacterium]